MFSKLKPKTEFSRNVLTLMTGTIIAQAIPIAISPILTRIYTPEDFGVFALYMSIAGIISVVATGRYELAIMLPKENGDAANLVVLSLGITFIISFISFFVILIFNTHITALFENNEISSWLYFIPITVMLSGIYQSFNYWHNRSKNYNNLSKGRILQSSITGSANLTIGPFASGATGLVFGNVLGQITSTFYLVRKSWGVDKEIFIKNIKLTKIIEVARRYKEFPKFDMLASFFNIASHQSTHLFFNIFFGSLTSGYFYLTQRIMGLPILVIASSIQDVFKGEMTLLYNKNGNTRELFIKIFFKLLLLSVIPTIFIYYFAVDIFIFFFGAQWKQAGLFVQILTPAFLLRFISFPLSFMIYIAEKQYYNIIGQFLLLIAMLLSFFIGKNYSAIFTVELISYSLSVFYASYIFLSFKFTSNGKNI